MLMGANLFKKKIKVNRTLYVFWIYDLHDQCEGARSCTIWCCCRVADFKRDATSDTNELCYKRESRKGRSKEWSGSAIRLHG